MVHFTSFYLQHISDYYYYNSTDPSPSMFQLDKHCEDPTCVGTVFTFKWKIFLDKYLHYPAGDALGHCTIVAVYPGDEHKPAVYKPYCLWSVNVDYKKKLDYDGYEKYHEEIYCDYLAEAALQGVGSLSGESTQLITALAGEFKEKYEGGSLTMSPTEKYPEVYKLHFDFHPKAQVEVVV